MQDFLNSIPYYSKYPSHHDFLIIDFELENT
jgi:hypothetical protein